MYAVIEDSGSQIKVSQGDIIKVANRDLPENATSITFDKVMLISDPQSDDAAKIGAPHLAGATVTGDILGAEKTDKVTIIKFKRRKGYKRKQGHRQPYLKVKVTAING